MEDNNVAKKLRMEKNNVAPKFTIEDNNVANIGFLKMKPTADGSRTITKNIAIPNTKPFSALSLQVQSLHFKR